MNNKKALIVDDDITTANMHKKIFEELGIKSNVVFSGQECIDELINSSFNYDIVVTDNQMPYMNGTELIRKLKKIDGFSIPVIIVTGDNNDNNIFTNYYGFDGYIQKPLNVDKVNDVIVDIIKNSEC